MKSVNLNIVILTLILTAAVLYKGRLSYGLIGSSTTSHLEPRKSGGEGSGIWENGDFGRVEQIQSVGKRPPQNEALKQGKVIALVRAGARVGLGPGVRPGARTVEGSREAEPPEAKESKFKFKESEFKESEALPIGGYYARELSQYADLKKKIFLTMDEQEQKDLLLKNNELLFGLRTVLMRPATTAAQALKQNVALDLLREALIVSKDDVAMEVLRAIIADGEDDTAKLAPPVDLEVSPRRHLAGVKAEIMHQWNTLKQSHSEDLATLLPGADFPQSSRLEDPEPIALKSSSP